MSAPCTLAVVASALNATIEETARAEAQMTEAEVFAAGAPFIDRVMTSGNFPRVAAFISEARHLDSEAEMWAGVDLILDGIAARLRPFSERGASLPSYKGRRSRTAYQ